MKTKFYIIVSIIIVSLVLSGNSIAQEFKSLEIKAIHEKVDSILDAYRLFNTFTEDDKEISQKYIDSYKNLFGNKKNQESIIVFNDIEKTGYLEEKVSLNEYIKSIKVFYKEGGLGIMIDKDSIAYGKPVEIKASEKQLYPGRNKYKINVGIKKRVFGFFNNKTLFDETFNIVLTITFNKHGDNFNGFIIQGVNSKETLIETQSKESKYEAGILFMPTGTRIVNKDKTFYNDYKTGFQLNANLTYYYKKLKYFKLGAGLGLGVSKYKAELYETSFSHKFSNYTDIDGDNYDLNVNTNGKRLSDILKLTYFDISLNLISIKNYKWLSNITLFNGLEFSGTTGFIISFNISKKSNIKTELTTTGTYAEPYNVELENIDYLGFFNEKDIDEETETKISSTNISYFWRLGFSKPIIHNLSINAGGYFVYGLSNISDYGDESGEFIKREGNRSDNTYNSLLINGSKTHTTMYGVYFGLSYKM